MVVEGIVDDGLFLLKPKTSDEVSVSVGSSDVCASDLVCSLTLTSPRQSAVRFWIVPVANMMITDRARTEPSARSVAPQALVYHFAPSRKSLRFTYCSPHCGPR